MKVLSIIIPSYNMEAYLPKCLESIVGNEDFRRANVKWREVLLPELDIVVVNDGSKDRTSEIAHEWELRFPEIIRVIDKPNGNYGSCINAALPVLNGVFVKVLDADDTFDVNGLEGFVEMLRSIVSDPGPELVLSDYEVVNECDCAIECHTYDFPVGCRFDVVRLGQNKAYLPMHAFTYRVTMLRGVGYNQCEGVSYSDTEWIWLPISGVREIVYYKGVVYRYLRGRDGQTMDPAVFARNYQMTMRVVLHALFWLKTFQGYVSNETHLYVQKLLKAHAEGLFRRYIFMFKCRDERELRSFDDTLRRDFPECYEQLNDAIYSRRLKYHFIRGFRHNSFRRIPMELICRLYSRIVSRKS